MNASVDGKVVVVTGSGRGLGRGLALALAKAGARVVLASRSIEPLREVEDEIRGFGGTALALVCDVCDEGNIQSVLAAAHSEFGQLDGLINNAQAWGAPGQRLLVAPDALLEDFPESWWDHTFQTGIKATFLASKAAFPYLKDRGGRIVNLGSLQGITGSARMPDYAANKEAIRGFTRSAARAWGQYGITVNVVCPVVASESSDAWSASRPDEAARTLAATPLGRLGDPETDIGPLIVFLVSDDSRFLTGHTFMADGGRHIL